MPKFKRGKSLIICLLCFMMILTTLFSVVKIDAIKNKFTDKSDIPQAANGQYTFDATYLTPSNALYIQNSMFYISSPAGLYAFSDSVAAGCSFAGKSVFLKTNIDWSKGNIDYWQPIGEVFISDDDENKDYRGCGSEYKFPATPFKGNFYGQGYTISNLYCEMTGSFIGSGDEVGLAFFGRTENAEIYDLKIQNMKIKNYDTGSLESYMSGFVGMNFGNLLISNCSLENISITYVDGCTDSYFGGFLCYSYIGQNYDVNIYSCYFKNITRTVEGDAKAYWDSYVGPSYYVIKENIPSNLTLEEVLNILNDIIKNACKYYNIYVDVNNDLDFSLAKYFDPKETLEYPDLPNIYPDTSDIYTNATDARNNLKNNELWFVVNERGYTNPYLRAFMNLYKPEFVSSTGGAVNEIKSIYVPNGQNAISDLNNKQLVQEYWTGIVEVTPDKGYIFNDWTYELVEKNGVNVHTYTAHFLEETYNLIINIYDVSGSKLQTLNAHVQYKNEIDIDMVDELNNDNILITNLIISNLNGSTISANIDNKYTYDSSRTTLQNDVSLEVGDYTNNATITLNIYLKYKTYGVEVG